MSSAQQLQPLPSLEPAIFASLVAELGFVPTTAEHPFRTDDGPAPAALTLLAVPADPVPPTEVDEVDEVDVVDEVESEWSEGPGWADDERTDQAWSAEEPTPVVEMLDEVHDDAHVEAPTLMPHGVPARRIPSMPPISRS